MQQMLLGASGAFQPLLHLFTSGSGTEIIPPGATTLVIEADGASGSGGSGSGVGCAQRTGGGASSGSLCRSSYNVSGQEGLTLNYVVGAGGTPSSNPGTASTVTSGTFAITSMNAPGGLGGGNAPTGTGAAAPSNATGGNVANTAGNAGFNGGLAGSGNGGAGLVGTVSTGQPGGAGGVGSGSPGLAGGNGFVGFSYV